MQASVSFKQFLFSVEDIKKEDGVWSLVYFPLEAPIDSTFDEVCTELKRQILNYLTLVKGHLEK